MLRHLQREALLLPFAFAFSFWFSCSRGNRATPKEAATRPRQRVEPIHAIMFHGKLSLINLLSLIIFIFLWPAEARLGASPSRPSLCRRAAFPDSRQSTLYAQQSTQFYMCYVTLRLHSMPRETGTVGRGSSLRGRVFPCIRRTALFSDGKQ